MKSKEEIEKLAEKHYTQITLSQRTAFKLGYTQCQQDMADEIKEAYIQGLLEGYACMPSIEGMPLINSLNKQD